MSLSVSHDPRLRDWVPRHAALTSTPRLRIVTFPSAGAGFSNFGTLFSGLPDGVEHCAAQAPGRAGQDPNRRHHSVHTLASEAFEVLGPLLDVPFVFVGYSMGALVAFELAQRLRAAGLPGPRHLFVLSTNAPQVPRGRSALHRLPADAFVRGLEGLYGPLPAVLKAEPDLLRRFLEVTRADVEAFETYTCTHADPLNCPIDVWYGTRDAGVSAEGVRGWSKFSGSTFEIHEVAAGHFVVADNAALVRRILLPLLLPYAAGVADTEPRLC